MKKFFMQIDKAVLGSLSAFIFFVLGFLWWVFEPDYSVPMWVVSLVVIGCYLICIVVYALCSFRGEHSIYRLPAVKSIIRINDKLIFIVEKNELFSQGSYATICYQDGEDSLETVLGLGYVQSVNSAGALQIELLHISGGENEKELCEKIENTSFFCRAIKIKPSIHRELMEEEM